MSPGSLLLAAGLASALAIGLGPRHPRVWLLLAVLAASAGAGAALAVLLGPSDWEWRSVLAPGGEPLHLRLDGLSAWFLLLVSAIGGTGAVYASGYWDDRHHPASAPRSRAWWSALAASMALVLLCSNGLHFLVAWELFAICGYFLITLERERREVRAAGWLYLAASHAGTLGLFAFFAVLAARTGSWDLGPTLDRSGCAPWFWLALFGFGVKAGFFPLHVWLPSAHANAPSHVSAMLSGAALKMGIYGIVRFGGWLPAPAGAGWALLGLGAASAVIGIAYALVQNDLKRLLAYCSVEHVGVILVGLGGALLARRSGSAAWGRLALAGALLHVWSHGAFKSLLFFGSGSVLHATGTREMSRLGGLWRRMPWTAGLFALGAVAVAGLPPLNGFVGEFLEYLGLLGAAADTGSFRWAVLPAVILLAVAGALALAAFLKACGVVFLGAHRTKAAAAARESGAAMLAPMFALAGACLFLGLAPVATWGPLSRATSAWNPAWPPIAAPAPLIALGTAHVALAVFSLVACAGLVRTVRVRGSRRAPTWDCGYASPGARMQYTSGSFAGIVSAWLGWLFRPDREARRPRGTFPVEARRLERVPETVLERVIAPAGDVVLRTSLAARRLQHGRLQAYILYLLVGLAGVAVLVLSGGAR